MRWSVLAVGALLAVPAAAAAPSPRAAFPGAPSCRLFPDGNVWNRRVDGLKVAKGSDAIVRAIGADAPLHPDWSSIAGGNYGIPYNVVGAATPRSAVRFRWPDESDAGPYPIPAKPRMEGGSDRHVLLVDRDACRLYELFAAQRSGGRWSAGSGAIWDLASNALRPDGWTSADAAGLPILPGLARLDEVTGAGIQHALRFTAPRTRSAHVYPARHDAGESNDPGLPPMGLRVRLKASVSLAGYGPQARAVLTALRRYGAILADNGSPWYVTGAPAAGWDDDDLHALGRITGKDFEVVDTSTLRNQ